MTFRWLKAQLGMNGDYTATPDQQTAPLSLGLANRQLGNTSRYGATSNSTATTETPTASSTIANGYEPPRRKVY